MSLAGKRMLVTGAGGFIGSHLAEALVREGASVTALAHYRGDGKRGFLDESSLRSDMELVLGDVRDGPQMLALVRDKDIVCHLAALIGIPYSYEASSSYVDANIVGTLNMLEACRNCGVERLLVTSTSEVYGSAQYLPIDEQHPLQGQSPYSASKIGADKLAEAYFLSFEVPLVTVRPFNTYGPRQSSRAVIPTIINQALTGGPLRLGSLTPRRDFTFVDDTVRGFVALAKAANAIGYVVNLGSGTSFTIGEIATRLCQAIGLEESAIHAEAGRVRPERSEVLELLSDNSLARKLASWEPEVTFDEGLRRTIEWFAERSADPDRYQR